MRVERGNNARLIEFTNMTMAEYDVYKKQPRTNIYVLPSNTSRLMDTRFVKVFGSLQHGDDYIYEIFLKETPLRKFWTPSLQLYQPSC